MRNPLHHLTKTHTTDTQPHHPQQPTETPPKNNHWTNQANCKNKTHLMFPKEHKDLSYISEARRLCRACPVRKECLEYALEFPASDQHGVWAGLTPRQLAAEASRRGVRAERFTLAQVWSRLYRQ
jgi:hypothetical protein